MRSRCPAARRSGSMRLPACRHGCTNRAAALPFATARVPIVPGAIMFDLLSGGDKNGAGSRPIASWAIRRRCGASLDFALGSAGAGLGATVANLKGGLGSASAVTADGVTIGALVVVNAVGTVTIGDGPHFWAAPFEQDREFGGLGWPQSLRPGRACDPHQGRRPAGHHHRAGRNRCDAHQGAGASTRGDGADRNARARSIRCIPRSTAISSSLPRPARSRCPIRYFRSRRSARSRPMCWRAPSPARVYEATALPFPARSVRGATSSRKIRQIHHPRQPNQPCAACVIAIGRYSSCKDLPCRRASIREASYNRETKELRDHLHFRPRLCLRRSAEDDLRHLLHRSHPEAPSSTSQSAGATHFRAKLAQDEEALAPAIGRGIGERHSSPVIISAMQPPADRPERQSPMRVAIIEPEARLAGRCARSPAWNPESTAAVPSRARPRPARRSETARAPVGIRRSNCTGVGGASREANSAPVVSRRPCSIGTIA